MGIAPHKRRVKLALLEQAGPEQLRDRVDALAIEGADRRSSASMPKALSRARQATAERLLPLLGEDEVKAVCEALPDVCRHLGLDLDHHDAASDARACAHIVLAAEPRQVARQLGG